MTVGMRLRGVGKRYQGGPWVLADVDVDLPSGELVAFCGGNGSGKSTLLRVLVGVTRPTTGVVEGRPREVGYVPERFPPDDRMSARQYLTHMGRVRGLTTAAATDRADELLGRLVLVGGPDTPLRALSKGNAQKVALAQALLVPPRLLVLDEPWSGVDASVHVVLAEILRETAADGACVVFTDHRESVVRANASRVYRLVDGRLATDEGNEPGELRIVLRAPVDEFGIPVEADWSEIDGIVSAVSEAENLVLRVGEAYADAVVVAALEEGWSLVSASRS